MTRIIAKEMIEGLNQLADSLEKGEDISKKFNVRDVALEIHPTNYSPALVRKTRKSLNASQAFFASFLGVAPSTVRSWEHGNNVPSGMAARFLDEIRRDPDYWKSRIKELASVRTAKSNRRPKPAAKCK
jgi:DNA-binding transcriptional regulator YiaG